MLTLANLTKTFRGQRILDGVNWFAPGRTCIGLTGANGAGKSTLLKIIAGEIETDTGDVVVPKGTTVGYLPQEVLGSSGQTVRDSALEAFAEVRGLENECRRLENALADAPVEGPEHDRLMAAYHDAREQFDTRARYDLEADTDRVLTGLGFEHDDFTRDVGTFSGGWQMRVALARLLLRRPDVLLLDEPTNHLDLEARTWLEEFLASCESLVILVAHDRYFLDVCVQRITEVSRGRLTDYPCNYTAYLTKRAERQVLEAQAYTAQQEEIERIEAFVRRFRYQASKAALVQSRVKQLEKIERLPPPEGHTRRVAIRLPDPPRSGRTVLTLEGASKSYGDLCVYEGLDLMIERGTKVALVGPNGAGKSTLQKMLAGVEPLSTGRRVVGHNTRIAYFAQDQSSVLDPTKTVYEELLSVAPLEMVPRVRDLLGAFLFGGDASEKPVRVLSGGERNRLALAKLLVEPANCLLLDEPTNHLDLAAKEVLLEALLAYTGTVVLVAHDRYILDRLPTEVLEIGHGAAVRHLGNYGEYLRHKERELPDAPVAAPSMRAASAETEQPVTSVEPKEDRNAARQAERRKARVEEKRQREAQSLETEIAAKETELARHAEIMNDPDFYQTHPEPQVLFSTYAKIKREVETLYSRLERVTA